MTEEQKKEYFKQIKNLCKACGLSVDKIARQFNINQYLVAELFIQTFQMIIKEIK